MSSSLPCGRCPMTRRWPGPWFRACPQGKFLKFAEVEQLVTQLIDVGSPLSEKMAEGYKSPGRCTGRVIAAACWIRWSYHLENDISMQAMTKTPKRTKNVEKTIKRKIKIEREATLPLNWLPVGTFEIYARSPCVHTRCSQVQLV